MALSPITFSKQAVDEIKKVTWPTRAEIIRLTVAVIAISVIVGIFLGVIDSTLTKIMELLITKAAK